MTTPVDLERVRALVDRGAQLVEVLPEPEHLPGALLPLLRRGRNGLTQLEGR